MHLTDLKDPLKIIIYNDHLIYIYYFIKIIFPKQMKNSKITNNNRHNRFIYH